MTNIEKQYVNKMKELIELLDDCNFSTMVDKSQWKERKRLYDEIASLEVANKQGDNLTPDLQLPSDFPGEVDIKARDYAICKKCSKSQTSLY